MEDILAHIAFHVLALTSAGALDCMLGDAPTQFHPVGWMGKGIAFLWSKRPHGARMRLFLWGLFIVIFGLAVTLVLTWPLQWLLKSGREISAAAAVFIMAILFKPSFSIRGLIRGARQVEKAINTGDIESARLLTETNLVSRSLDGADSSYIASAAIESLSENFTDSIAGPSLFFLLGGLPGAWAYRFVNTADAMLGYHGGQHEWGGKAAARLDDVFNLFPARISGIILIAAAYLLGYDGRGALRMMKHDSMKCLSPNSGWTMAAAAGALGVRLEKPGFYVLNDMGLRPSANDLRRGIVLILVSIGLLMFLITIPVMTACIILKP